MRDGNKRQKDRRAAEFNVVDTGSNVTPQSRRQEKYEGRRVKMTPLNIC